jgi:hypothetical protein
MRRWRRCLGLWLVVLAVLGLFALFWDYDAANYCRDSFGTTLTERAYCEPRGGDPGETGR